MFLFAGCQAQQGCCCGVGDAEVGASQSAAPTALAVRSADEEEELAALPQLSVGKLHDEQPAVADLSSPKAACGPSNEAAPVSGEKADLVLGAKVAEADARVAEGACEVKAADVIASPASTKPETEVPLTPLKAPLEEDQVLYDVEAQRLDMAKGHLASLRSRLTAAMPSGEESVMLARNHFCSDATLLRYLCTCDGNEDRALSMLLSTLRWRESFLGTDALVACAAAAPSPTALKAASCKYCAEDPKAHCFLDVGVDAIGRRVIYSCAGRAADKNPDHGCNHMALELERIFDGNSAEGTFVWVLDFKGFGLADCNPRTASVAVPMFLNHYPERFGQIILVGFPTLLWGLYNAIYPLLDSVTKKRVVILRNDEARRRYVDAYWKCSPSMHTWLEAVLNLKANPASYPNVELSRALDNAETRRRLERCAT